MTSKQITQLTQETEPNKAAMLEAMRNRGRAKLIKGLIAQANANQAQGNQEPSGLETLCPNPATN